LFQQFSLQAHLQRDVIRSTGGNHLLISYFNSCWLFCLFPFWPLLVFHVAFTVRFHYADKLWFLACSTTCVHKCVPTGLL